MNRFECQPGVKAHSTLVALVAAQQISGCLFCLFVCFFLRKRTHTGTFEKLEAGKIGVKKQRGGRFATQNVNFKFCFFLLFFKIDLFCFSTHTNNWYFAYNVIIKMIRWHGFCALFCFCVFFCLLFLSNCLLHYLTNPMIIIYFVCLSCFFFSFVSLFPSSSNTHTPTFVRHLRVRLAFIKYSNYD